MSDMNVVALIGRLGRAPECRHNDNGNAFSFLSLANTKKWRDRESGQQQERTAWLPVLLTGKDAENAAKYLVQGQEVRITGELQTRTKQENGKDITEVYVKAITIDYGAKPQGVGGDRSGGHHSTGGNHGGNNGGGRRGAPPQGRPGGGAPRSAPPQRENGGSDAGNGGGNFGDWDDDIPFDRFQRGMIA